MARRVDGWAFVAVLVVFALVPPLVLLALEAAAGVVSARLRRWLHLVFAWGLIALTALYALKTLAPAAGLALVLVGWGVGLVGVAAYARFGPVRSFLTALSPAPLVFLILFVAFSPAKALLFPAGAPAAAADQGSDTPVVMVIFDELPVSSIMDGRGRIDAARYPGFGELARDATWYSNTTSTGDSTEEAIPSILDGQRSVAGVPPIRSQHPDNLFTLLGASHDVHAMEHATWLCPVEYCPNPRSTATRMKSVASAMSLAYSHVVMPERYEPRLPAIGRTWGEALAPEDPAYEVDPARVEPAELSRHADAEFEQFLGSIGPDADGRPPLYFLHSNLPHVPWQFLPSGKAYTGIEDDVPGVVGNTAWSLDEARVNEGWQRHLLQAGFADRLLGRLVERLRQSGLYDRALVVVTADHGSSFKPGGARRIVTEQNAADVGLVPLFIKPPRQTRGRTVDESLQSIDVLPTMAEALEMPIPWRVDGRPAPAISGEGRREVTISRHTGGAVTLPAATLQEQRRETIARQVRLFGSGTDRPGLFGLGPNSELVGKRPDQLEVLESDGTSVELERAESYASVDLESRFLPARVEGRILGPDAAGVPEVAVAVNGRIEAVSETSRSGGEVRMSAIAPEEAFRDGANSVEVFAVSPTGGGAPTLRRLGGAGAPPPS